MMDDAACTLIRRKKTKIYEGVSQFCHSPRRCFLFAAYMIRLLKEKQGPPAASSIFLWKLTIEVYVLNRNTIVTKYSLLFYDSFKCFPFTERVSST